VVTDNIEFITEADRAAGLNRVTRFEHRPDPDGDAPGILWYLLGWVDERERGAGREGADALRATISEQAASHSDLQAELRRVAADLARTETRRDELVGRVRDLRAEIASLEGENAALRAQGEDLARANRENAALSADLSRLERELGRARGDAEEARETIEELRGQIAEKDRQIRALASRPPEGVAPAEAPEGAPEPEGAAAEPEPVPVEIPEEAVRDVAELERLRSVLNGLLLDAGGRDRYRFESIGAVRGKALYDVVVVHSDESGGETKRIEASEARLVLDEPQKKVEIRCRNGHFTYYGVRVPFWGGRFVVPVVGVDPVAWSRSGLTILETRR